MYLPRPARRVLIPLDVLVALALLVLLGLVGLVGLVTSPIDRRLRLARLSAMGISYLCVELAALVAFFVAWLTRPIHDREWWEAVNVRLLTSAVSLVLAAARRWTGLRIEIDGRAADGPFPHPEPVLVLARHGGIGDSFALVWVLAQRLKRRPRVVLKRQLLWDPMIDIALSRMGSCFLGDASPRIARRADRAVGFRPATGRRTPTLSGRRQLDPATTAPRHCPSGPAAKTCRRPRRSIDEPRPAAANGRRAGLPPSAP